MSHTLKALYEEAKTWSLPWTASQRRAVNAVMNLPWAEFHDWTNGEVLAQLKRQVDKWTTEEMAKRLTQ